MHQIKDGWTLKGKQASERGTYMHKQIELCLNARDFDDTMPEMEQFFDFRKEWMLDKKWEPWRTEWSIYDEHLMVAGQIDSIFKDEASARASRTTAGLRLAKRSKSFLSLNNAASGLFSL